MSRSRRLLMFSGLALALWGMCWGLFYAVFIEHQTLDAMGGEITTGFVRAARRDMAGAHGSLLAYARTLFNYVRQVDVHSHWIGLAMVLIILGVAFERVNFEERTRVVLALVLAIGSAVFPLGVILQTIVAGSLPGGLAVIGAVMVVLGLGGCAWGFARQPA